MLVVLPNPETLTPDQRAVYVCLMLVYCLVASTFILSVVLTAVRERLSTVTFPNFLVWPVAVLAYGLSVVANALVDLLLLAVEKLKRFHEKNK